MLGGFNHGYEAVWIWHRAQFRLMPRATPRIQPTVQWAHAFEAVSHQQLRDLCRGRFVWTRAVEHDVAVARQPLEMLINIRQRNAQRPRDCPRLQRVSSGRPDIDDQRRSAGFDELIKLSDADSRHAQRGVELAPPIPFIGNVGY